MKEEEIVTSWNQDVVEHDEFCREFFRGFRKKNDRKRSLSHEKIETKTDLLKSKDSEEVSERIFSSLRRLKTYLRSTMNQARPNHLAVLAVIACHKEVADALDLEELVNSRSGGTVRENAVAGSEGSCGMAGLHTNLCELGYIYST